MSGNSCRKTLTLTFVLTSYLRSPTLSRARSWKRAAGMTWRTEKTPVLYAPLFTVTGGSRHGRTGLPPLTESRGWSWLLKAVCLGHGDELWNSFKENIGTTKFQLFAPDVQWDVCFNYLLATGGSVPGLRWGLRPRPLLWRSPWSVPLWQILDPPLFTVNDSQFAKQRGRETIRRATNKILRENKTELDREWRSRSFHHLDNLDL